MSALVDKAIIAMLACAVCMLVWKLYRKEGENTGGASPEFIDKINKQTDEGNERLNWKKQSDKAATRIGA